MRDLELMERAKKMRREPTEPEYRLWLQLRAKRFRNIKFRHQKVVGRYIVDFAARVPMLVIELDGDTHAGSETYDAERTRFLESEGYQVIRFSNLDVMENMDGVLLEIERLCSLSSSEEIENRGTAQTLPSVTAPSPTPPLKERGE